MPNKKKKYNARFPPARIKKIMQSDDEIGKVAQAVPVIISRALELFVESLLKKAETVTQSRNAKTLTPSHLKQCIMAEKRFDFLKDLVATVPDVQGDEESAMAETPRSSTSNTAFLFPSASATSTNASASSSSSSGTSSPAGRSDPSDVSLSQQCLPKQDKSGSVSASGGYGYFYDQKPPIVGVAGGGAHQSLPMTMPMPNLSKRRISSTTVSTFPSYGLSSSTVTETAGASGGYQHQLQQESVIVTHPNYTEQHHNSILNPIGVNSNPYIPNISVPSHSGSMDSQYEYVPNINPNNNGLNMNVAGLSSNSGMNVPVSLALHNTGNNGGNNGSHPSSGGVIVYDNKNPSQYQPHYPSSNYDE